MDRMRALEEHVDLHQPGVEVEWPCSQTLSLWPSKSSQCPKRMPVLARPISPSSARPCSSQPRVRVVVHGQHLVEVGPSRPWPARTCAAPLASARASYRPPRSGRPSGSRARSRFQVRSPIFTKSSIVYGTPVAAAVQATRSSSGAAAVPVNRQMPVCVVRRGCGSAPPPPTPPCDGRVRVHLAARLDARRPGRAGGRRRGCRSRRRCPCPGSRARRRRGTPCPLTPMNTSWVLQLVAHALAAFGEFVAEAFAVGGRLSHADQCFPGAETQRHFHLLIREDAAFIQLHGGGESGPHRNRVHAEIVAQPVGLDDRVEVADAGVGPERPRRLVLRPLPGGLPVARMHVEPGYLSAMVPGRRVTRPQAMVQAKHALLATMRCSLIELPLRFSACSNWPFSNCWFGQPPKALVRSMVAAVPRSVMPWRPGASARCLRQDPAGFHELGGLGNLDAARAADRNRLQVFRSHDRADAGTAGRPCACR